SVVQWFWSHPWTDQLLKVVVSPTIFYMKSMKSAIDDLIPLDMSLLVNVCKSSSQLIPSRSI
ncbi:MAG: hypothetical protein WA323_14185, partial [Candidatus Nitrosopolaris sp.]